MIDQDAKFEIDIKTRKIINRSNKKNLIQFDHNSELVSFTMDRYIDGFDMSTVDKITIKFINEDHYGIYQVDGIKLTEDGESIIFTWLIDRNTTKNVGSVVVSITFESLDSYNNVIFSWSTQKCSMFKILECIEPIKDSIDPSDQEGIFFYDYDGSIVDFWTLEEAAVATKLPDFPNHPNLIPQEWNHTLAYLKTVGRTTHVGVTYINEGDKTKFYIITHDANDELTFRFNQSTSEGVEVDWGDGSKNVYTEVGNITVKHIYKDSGRYCISMSILNGTMKLVTVNNLSRFIEKIELGTKVVLVDGIFESLFNLININLPNGSLSFINRNSLRELSKLEHLSIPRSVKTIYGDNAYMSMKLKTICISENTTGLAIGCFKYSKSLENISLPNGVTNIPNSMLEQCVNLKSIHIPYGVVDIGKSSFLGCKKLSNVYIPNTVKNIYSSAFYGCSNLEQIKLPDGITLISDRIFQSAGLKSINIPEKVTVIYEYAFIDCYRLESINLPEGLKTINRYAFQQCKRLETITIPDTVEDFNVGGIFKDCYSLRTIKLSENLKSIPQITFEYCFSLESITIPSSVTSIENNVFNGCRSLAEIHMKSLKPPTLQSSTLIDTCAFDCVIYVPEEAVEEYKKATNWIALASRIKGE